MPIVTTPSIRCRQNCSANGLETRVKTPKNTTPMISMMRNSLRVYLRPATKLEGTNGVRAAFAVAAAPSAVFAAVPKARVRVVIREKST